MINFIARAFSNLLPKKEHHYYQDGYNVYFEGDFIGHFDKLSTIWQKYNFSKYKIYRSFHEDKTPDAYYKKGGYVVTRNYALASQEQIANL